MSSPGFRAPIRRQIGRLIERYFGGDVSILMRDDAGATQAAR